jgi:L-amino acid N-acyltransferase YncA
VTAPGKEGHVAETREAGLAAASEELGIRRATAADAPGVAAVLNEVIAGGRHSLLDTPFSDQAEAEYIEGLPERAFIHVAEQPACGIVAFQSVEPWAAFITHEFDHVATMGTYVTQSLRRLGLGGRLAQASFAAARSLGYEKIFTDVRADNLESLCYHRALGFAVVGTARRHAHLGDKHIDVVFVEKFL